MEDNRGTEILAGSSELVEDSLVLVVEESKHNGSSISAGANTIGPGNRFVHDEVELSHSGFGFESLSTNVYDSQLSRPMYSDRALKKLSNDSRLDMPAEMSEHDRWTTQQIGVLGYRAGNLEQTQSEIILPSIQGISLLQTKVQDLDAELADTQKTLSDLAELTGQQHLLIQGSIAKRKQELMAAYIALDEARNEKPTGDFAKTRLAADVSKAERAIYESATAILELTVEENLGKTKHPLSETLINALQTQLRQTIRLQKSTVNLTSSWSWRSFWAKDKNAQASGSVQKLAKNPAFGATNLEGQTVEQLEINARILRLMTHAMYALTTFDAASFSATGAGASSIYQSPARVRAVLLDEELSVPTGSRSAVKGPEFVSSYKGVNEAVMDVIRFDLAEIQKEAGGLIGSSNPNRQFWGRVLMVLALVIATMVAAVAVMSMLGFATPAFLVPYFAAIQASSMVSTVLNFVAAKLTLDLNTAAAVTAVATAGAFGVFGKAVHYSGAPTQLKRDLDRAAQDLEAALAETPAGLSMS